MLFAIAIPILITPMLKEIGFSIFAPNPPDENENIPATEENTMTVALTFRMIRGNKGKAGECR